MNVILFCAINHFLEPVINNNYTNMQIDSTNIAWKYPWNPNEFRSNPTTFYFSALRIDNNDEKPSDAMGPYNCIDKCTTFLVNVTFSDLHPYRRYNLAQWTSAPGFSNSTKSILPIMTTNQTGSLTY